MDHLGGAGALFSPGHTVLVLIKLTKFLVSVRFRFGCSKLDKHCGAVAFIFSIYLKPVLYVK